MAECKELKSLLMKVKEESGKVDLKLNIQKSKIMASSPITSWQIDGETVETMADCILGGSKITADSDCSHEVKRQFTPWKESYDQPRQHIQKQRHYFVTKGPSSQGYILSPCLFNFYAEYIMRNAGLEEAQARIKIARRNIQ